MRKTQSYQKQQSQNLRKKMANFLPSISHPVNSEKSTARFVQAIQDGISNGSLLRPSKNVQTKERLQKPPFPASFRLVVQKNLMPLVEIVMILEEVTNYMLQTKGTLLGNFKKKIILGATKKICELKIFVENFSKSYFINYQKSSKELSERLKRNGKNLSSQIFFVASILFV